MIKQRAFWVGVVVGFAVCFLYAWLAIWATYTGLERAHIQREAELRAVKKIIYFSEDIQSQHKESIGWNEQNMIPMPEWATEPKGDEQ